MPDPRYPQSRQPQSRQPAPQPAGRPQERPVPSEHKDLPAGIHAGDPNAAAKRGAARPVRPLAPEEQAPPVEVERKLKKGESYWIVGSEDSPAAPRKAKVIRLSNEVGKTIGVEFAEPIGGVDEHGQPWGVSHTCDGRGKLGHCLYVRPDQVLDEKAMQAHKARQTTEKQEAESKFEEYNEMTVGPQHSQVQTPLMDTSGRETMTIGKDDVGTIKAEDLEDEDEDEDK
jgi:hypothetical protein